VRLPWNGGIDILVRCVNRLLHALAAHVAHPAADRADAFVLKDKGSSRSLRDGRTSGVAIQADKALPHLFKRGLHQEAGVVALIGLKHLAFGLLQYLTHVRPTKLGVMQSHNYAGVTGN